MESFQGQGDIMGQEIADRHFRHRDFDHFRSRLHQETAQLHDWFEAGRFDRSAPRAGLELEAWLVERDGRPAPRNAEFLSAMQREDVVHELARFNVEINAAPEPLTDTGLEALHASLRRTWNACRETAGQLGLGLESIGILPTLRDEDLRPANMSAVSSAVKL